MLDIQVVMHGNLRRFLPEGIEFTHVQVVEGTTVRSVAQRFDAQDEVWLSAIDEVVVSMSEPLTHDATIDFFAILEGG
jgi:hypothetical protein